MLGAQWGTGGAWGSRGHGEGVEEEQHSAEHLTDGIPPGQALDCYYCPREATLSLNHLLREEGVLGVHVRG